MLGGKDLERAILDSPYHYNVLDIDSRRQPFYTKFTIPDAVKAVSVNEMVRLDMHEDCRADREASYLLLSAPGAVTLFHQDMTGTCVWYIILQGCKTFYVIRPSDNNQGVFNTYLDHGRKDLFIGGHPSLNAGGCQKIVLRAREAVCMPVGMIHAVETTGFSVALG